MAKNDFEEKVVSKILFFTAIFSILAILVIIIFIFTEGFPAIQEYGLIQFISNIKWDPTNGSFGVATMIVGSITVTLLALLIAVPISLLCAIFMVEVSPESMRILLKPVIQTLSGIPSVVYGFFGLIVLVPFMRENFGGTGFSMLSASIILSVMIMPTIISISQDALKAVPMEYREASLGLGATNWQTIKNIIFPTALPGILTSIILGMGRAIGETLAVIMVAGNVTQIPNSILDPVRTLTSNIALEMGYATGLHYNALFGTAIILFFMIILLLLLTNYLKYKYKVDVGGGNL